MYQNQWKLIEEITRLSEKKEWEVARKEWLLFDIYIEDDPENYQTCVCGHYPIKEIIELINKHNNNRAIVGNCCIQVILGEKKNKFFSCLIRGTVNPEIIERGYKDKIINSWEYKFMLRVCRKRNLSAKQNNIYTKINKCLLDFYIRRSVTT